MAKYKKKVIHMVDMSGRLNVKIISETTQTNEMWEMEMKDIDQKIEARMIAYEEHLKDLIIEAISTDVVSTTKETPNYFIEKYSEKFIGRNTNNIKNRLELYQKYIKEQES